MFSVSSCRVSVTRLPMKRTGTRESDFVCVPYNRIRRNRTFVEKDSPSKSIINLSCFIVVSFLKNECVDHSLNSISH